MTGIGERAIPAETVQLHPDIIISSLSLLLPQIS
jgi:hypothetical protein